MWMNETAFDASYGVLPWLAIEARLSLRLVDVKPSYFELDGTPKSVPNEIHHHDETLLGPGDPWLLARVGGASGKLVSTARAGVSLPLGSTVPDPYALGREGKSHEHIQFGTGTFVPIAGGALQWASRPVDFAATVLGLFSMYENDQGFRAPLRFFASVRSTLRLDDAKLFPFVAVDFAHEGRERWHGAYGIESYVRNDVLAGAGVGWAFARDWLGEIGFRVRVLDYSNGPTLDYPGILQLSVATHFDDVGVAHERGHQHQH
jgi:hypothetical protein